MIRLSPKEKAEKNQRQKNELRKHRQKQTETNRQKQTDRQSIQTDKIYRQTEQTEGTDQWNRKKTKSP